MSKVPPSVATLAALIQGQKNGDAANTLAGAKMAAYKIYSDLKWTFQKKDYTNAEAIAEIEKAIKRTQDEVKSADVVADAVKKYNEMIQQLRA